MPLRRVIAIVAIMISSLCAVPGRSGTSVSVPIARQLTPFLVAPHDDVSIEWWYLNAHVTTTSGRHVAMIASFFRFGDVGASPSRRRNTSAAQSHSHYLIYAITDDDAKTHQTYSLADANSLQLLQQAASVMLLRNPASRQAQQLLAIASNGHFPPPTELIQGACRVTNKAAFAAHYGSAASLMALPGQPNSFELTIAGHGPARPTHLDLRFSSTRPTMLVGGSGNTGVVRPEDMKYVSLTRCAVTGTIGTEAGTTEEASGIGWFDHQWGSSWTPQAVGWDWWGVQLGDGRDILFYRMRHMRDGKIFSALATIEDPSGKLTVTHNVVFTPDPQSVWTSPVTHVSYPLTWTVTLPDQNLKLAIAPKVQDQEMPVIASGGAIWEGSVTVDATPISAVQPAPIPSTGVGYQELVGYFSPYVAKALRTATTPKP